MPSFVLYVTLFKKNRPNDSIIEMSSSLPLTTQIVNDLNAAMLGTGSKKASGLVPVAEKPATMWVCSQAWEQGTPRYNPGLLTVTQPPAPAPVAPGQPAPAVPAAIQTPSVGTMFSNTLTALDEMMDYSRMGLTGLLVAIANKTPNRAANVPISGKEIVKWANFITTYARAVFEAPNTQSGKGATETAIPVNVMTDIRYLADAAGTLRQVPTSILNVTEYNTRAQAVVTALSFPDFTDLSAAEIIMIATRDPIRENAAYYAMIIYMSGRVINNKTNAAVNDRRPKNLFDKFNGGRAWNSVGGTMKWSQGAYEAVGLTWQMNPTLRMSFLIPLISLSEGDAQVTGNIVNTMFKMHSFAGMAHVDIISQFAAKYPYSIELPDTMGEYQLFASHVKALTLVEPSIRPYYKLLYSDGTRLFDRKKLVRLTGLAVEIMGLDDSNLLDYAHIKSDELIEKFNVLRTTYEAEEA